jgi:hypothetical protein
MRKRLMAAAAATPLLFGWQAAHAQTTDTISNTLTTQVSTATAVNGGPADISITGGVQPTVAGPAVTLNSNNSVTNSGSIQINNVSGVTGILVAPGSFTGNVTNTGTITLGESYTASDSVNGDGVAEAPFAQGTSRTGIEVSGTLTGVVANTGTISLQANAGTTQGTIGISIDAPLIAPSGNTSPLLSSSGAITVTGDNDYGIRTTAAIGGTVQITGAITMKGQNSVALLTTAPISGSLRIYSAIQSTGYSLTSRTVSTTVLQNVEKTPADVQQGGSAVQIQGSVLGGVFLGAPPSGTVSTDTTTDADGDGIVDSAEGTSSITTYGSAPALQIGSATSPITLGAFGAGTNAYGLIIRGTVVGNGLFDGVTSTAIDIGAGGGGVTFVGGIDVVGTVSATAYQANATAIHIGAGTTIPTLRNDGAITSTITSSAASTSTVLQIDAGATINNLYNYGSLTAGVTGNTSNASVVIDKSGSLNNVLNQGSINVSFTAGTVGQSITGAGVGLDLSSNTTGVTLLQSQSTTVTTAPVIIGDVLLSPTGSNTVDIENGSVYGTLSLGSAPSRLTINNGALYTGQLLYGGSALAINVPAGTLQDNSATTVGASSLTLGASSTLTVALDPAHNASSLFNVSGAATFASGAKIGATLLSEPAASGDTFTIVKAGSLSVGTADQTLLSSLPYLFQGSVATNPSAGMISITVRTKTTTELGFNKAETSAFPAIYAALPQDSGIEGAIIGAGSRQSLVSTYDQLLPDSSGDVFETARGMSKAISRAASERFDLSTEQAEEDIPTKTGFWASEFYSGIEQNKQDNNAYHSAGLGIIGGYDLGGLGFTVSAASANVVRPHISGDSSNSISVVEGGLYAAPRFGPIFFDARVAAGYVKVADRRQLVVSVVAGDLSTVTSISRTAQGDWSGYDFTGHVGAGVQWDIGRHLFFQPKVYADIFHLHEGAYSERNAGSSPNPQGFLLDVNQRDSTQSNATASIVTGLKFGSTFVFTPQLELGYDDVISGGAGDTTARFAYGGPSFTVAANRIGGAAMARITLRGDGNFLHFSVQGGGEYNNSYRSMDLKAVFRLLF